MVPRRCVVSADDHRGRAALGGSTGYEPSGTETRGLIHSPSTRDRPACAARQAVGRPFRKAAARSRASSRTGFSVWPRRGYVTSSARAQARDRRAQEIDPRERIRLARQQQDRTADGRPVGDPRVRPLRGPGRVERVAEQDEARIGCVGFGGGEARHAAAVRVPSDRDVGAVGDDEMEGRQRILGLAPGQVDGGGVDAARPQAVHERRHAGRRPARAVSQEAPDTHRHRVAAEARPGYIGHGPVGSWPSGRASGHPRRPNAPEGPVPLTPATRRATHDRSSIAIGVVVTLLVVLLGSMGGGPRTAFGADGGQPPSSEPTPTPTPTPTPIPTGPTVLGPTVTFFGRGYGHGVGMSQYGRQGTGPGRPGRGDHPRPLLPRHDARDDIDLHADPRPDPLRVAGDAVIAARRLRPPGVRGPSTASPAPSRRMRCCGSSRRRPPPQPDRRPRGGSA